MYLKVWLLAGVVFAACSSGEAVREENFPEETYFPGVGSKTIYEIDWFLQEVRTSEGVIILDRSKMEAEEMGDFFSLRFNERGDQISGKAAPNRYRAPCEWGDDNTLGFETAAATMMMAFKEPEGLNEREFFDYLSKVERWDLTLEGQLEFLTFGKDGSEAALIFSKKR